MYGAAELKPPPGIGPGGGGVTPGPTGSKSTPTVARPLRTSASATWVTSTTEIWASTGTSDTHPGTTPSVSDGTGGLEGRAGHARQPVGSAVIRYTEVEPGVTSMFRVTVL